ncbi:MAG: hypothetical protein HQM02_01560 [Magnetococcales bacterium]|nr:hypothetical protein [Magnetococcales bacterium]
MITKTLMITCNLFDATARIQAQLGDEGFARDFLPMLRLIHHNLAQGPNPDISIPLVDALEWGFHSPAQPIVETIIQSQGFDWRFITGRRRQFKALAAGEAIPPPVSALWHRALEKSRAIVANHQEAG